MGGALLNDDGGDGEKIPRARVLTADILAGYIGGSAKYILFHPFDTLSTILEADRGATSLPRALSRLVSDGGVQALFAGLPTTLALGFPYAAIYHSVFATVRDAASSSDAMRGGAASAVAAASAAAAGAIIGVPSECLKHRLQVGQYGSVGEALGRTLGRRGSWRELYAGFASTLLRNVPYNAIQFGTFAGLQRGWSAARGRPTTGAEDAAIGSAAGLLTAIGTNPIDVVNTRLQVYPSTADGAGSGAAYRGVRDAFGRIVREEGAPALFKVRPHARPRRGAAGRLRRAGRGWCPGGGLGPSGAVFFAVYERVRRRILRAGRPPAPAASAAARRAAGGGPAPAPKGRPQRAAHAHAQPLFLAAPAAFRIRS
eukprot:tig00000754_g3890.t1